MEIGENLMDVLMISIFAALVAYVVYATNRYCDCDCEEEDEDS